ncbi:MAG: LuxR C-terminal-related transcriptional regulator [Pseudomonadota bacterium]
MRSSEPIDEFSRAVEQIDAAADADAVVAALTALSASTAVEHVALGAISAPNLSEHPIRLAGASSLAGCIEQRLGERKGPGTRLVLVNETTDQDADVREAIDELACRSCILVSHREASSMAGVVAVASRDAFLSTRTVAELRALAHLALTRIFALERAAIAEAVALSKREAVCLAWVAHGKSDWEIGQILEISPKTVNFHVENAKRRLGVPSRTQAVLLAALNGGIELTR